MSKKTEIRPPQDDENGKVYRVYIMQGGGYLAAEEVGRQQGEVEVKDPVFVVNSADGTGFDMRPVQFVSPGNRMRLYQFGLLGDVIMPKGMVPWYQKHQEQRVRQEEQQP